MNKQLPIIHAGSARSWKYCIRRAWFDYYPPEDFEPPNDPFENLVAEMGLKHEETVKKALGEVIEATSAEHTLELMKKGTSAIYQPILIDQANSIVGKPDFLILNDEGKYQVADAKLAKSLDDHPEIKLQLGLYLRLLGTDLPALAYLGSDSVGEVGEEVLEDVEKFVESMREALTQTSPPRVHFSDSKCRACPYDATCRPSFIDNDELTLVYGVDARSLPGLHAQGITTISELASSEPDVIEDVPYLKGFEKKNRAVLQARSFLTGEVFQIAPLVLPRGTWVHFDVEVNPLAIDMPNSVYIWGWLPPAYEKESFSYTWSDGAAEDDYSAWTGFLKEMEILRERYTDLILVHFSHYEKTQLRAYASRYDMAEHPTVRWLLGEDSPLFDILAAVKKALVLPLVGYGLKAICKDERLVNFQWELKESGSQWSVVRYLDYLKAEDGTEREHIREEIVAYNRDDVRATRALEMWLRARTSSK